MKELAARKEYATSHGMAADADIIDAQYEVVDQEMFPGGLTAATWERAADFFGAAALPVKLAEVPPAVLHKYFSDDPVWRDRLKRDALTPPERTIGALVSRWISGIQEEARKGLRSSDGAAALAVCIGHFKRFMGENADPAVITFVTWKNWYDHCREMVAKRDAADGKRVKNDDGTFAGWSADTAKKVFGVSRTFVRWLHQTDKLAAPPKNLDDKSYRFEAEDRDPATFRTAEVQQLLRAAHGVHRLILLLSLNCGMYGKDVSDLRKSQINFEAGRITRRRSKTRRKKGSPKVSYRLWPETLGLLRQYIDLNPAEPRALVTKSGKPWVWTETTASGKKRKSDNVATIFNNLKRRVGMLGPDKSFKVFRKTSATRIGNKEQYAALRILFLGHKPREVADKHYVRAGRRALDKAINWLRKTYKLDALDTPPTESQPERTPT